MDYKNKNILDAFWCSIDGLKILFKEKAARRELLLVIFSILYIFLMKPDLNMIIWLIVLPLLFVSIEALKTGIEYTWDKLTIGKSNTII